MLKQDVSVHDILVNSLLNMLPSLASPGLPQDPTIFVSVIALCTPLVSDIVSNSILNRKTIQNIISVVKSRIALFRVEALEYVGTHPQPSGTCSTVMMVMI